MKGFTQVVVINFLLNLIEKEEHHWRESDGLEPYKALSIV